MKVLWFSNCAFTNSEINVSGSWLYTMAMALKDSDVQLYNITQGNVSSIKEEMVGSIKQWILPTYKLSNGLPEKNNINKIVDIYNSISPDITHIWGMESYWGLLSARGYIAGRILLEIQGIRESCSEVFYGGLSFKEQIRSFGIKELIRPSISLWGLQRRHKKWATYEHEMLSHHNYIATQSDWVRRRISFNTHSSAKIYESLICVRSEFIHSRKWTPIDDDVVFTMTTSASSLRAIHNVVKAVALLKRDRPNIKLVIAGDFDQGKPLWRKSGYVKFIEHIIQDNGMQDNVVFVGRLKANEIVEQMLNSSVFVQSSFVESYSLALSEALCVGIPCVVSYAGAMPEFDRIQEFCKYYSPQDYIVCAAEIREWLDSKGYNTSLYLLKEKSVKSNNLSELRDRQLMIYNDILRHE